MKRYHVIVVEASTYPVYVPPVSDSKTPISDAMEEILARSPRPALDVIVDVQDTETERVPRDEERPSEVVPIPVQRQVRMALEAARPQV